MASALTKRVLSRVADTGFLRAKKLADLSIKTNTDSKGSPTARGYKQALTYLQPYINSGKGTETLDAQRIIASYNNSLDKLIKRKRNQNETIAAFKLQELDSYFTSFDGDVGGFRNPASLIGTTSESLDSLLLGVINAIDEKEADGDSTDALYGYMNDLNKRADKMRDLRNKFENGELTGKTLDGFGYYVDSNPLDGSIRGAALLPVGLAPSGITKGYRRLEATTNVGGALLPVYAPSQQDELGEYKAQIGDAIWSGVGKGVLQSEKAGKSKILFSEGAFNIGDSLSFPVRKNEISKGAFGKGFIGRDAEGSPVESILYRGANNKLYTVDQETVDQFRQDPLLSRKLDGYIAQFSPTEMEELSREAIPFTEEQIGTESKISGFQAQAAEAKAESDRMENLGFFGRLKEGFGIKKERRETFFEKKNRLTPPREFAAPLSTPEIIEKGKGFFRKVGSFIRGEQ